jgi:cytochrome b6-f complex iron-sulfur subunit
MSANNKSKHTLPRRDFMKYGLGALGALALLELGGASLLYLQPRDLAEEFGGVVTAGEVESFPAGSVTEFPTGRFFLIRSAEGGFLAMYNRCPHLGCTVNWQADQNGFHCPCHASSFDSVGNFKKQPVPRALDIFPVTIADQTVLVDTSRSQQRLQFAPDQLVYPVSETG